MTEPPTSSFSDALVEEIAEAIRREEPIRCALPGDGRVRIDRSLPYLLVYRHPAGADPGTVRLVLGEASYLVAADQNGIPELVRCIAEAGSEEYGAFLVLEVWASENHRDRFTIRCPEGPAPATVHTLQEGLRGLAELCPGTVVDIKPTEERQPPGMTPLLSIRECWDIGCLLLGLEVPPVYRAHETGDLYPVFLRTFRRKLSQVLRQTAYEFIRVQTRYAARNYRALGTRTLHDSVWKADRELSKIERSYPFLVLTSPVNETQAWQQFRESG
jgi:hypothetical protein